MASLNYDHKSNADEADDAGIEGLLAQAQDIMNNADAVLAGTEFVDAELAAA